VCLGRGAQDRLLAVLALLQLGRVLERAACREGLLRRVVELVDDGAGGRGDGIRGGRVGAFFLLVCALSALFLGWEEWGLYTFNHTSVSPIAGLVVFWRRLL
jgi:hypothetical protein